MNCFIFFLLIFFSISCFNFNSKEPFIESKSSISQNLILSDSIQIDTASIIEHIEEIIKMTNTNINSFNIIDKNLYGVSSEGGSYKAFLDNDELKKIEVTYYGEMGKSDVEYYTVSDNLIAVIKKEYHYDKPIYIKNFALVKEIENKYYYSGDTLIKHINLSTGEIYDIQSDKHLQVGHEIIKEFNKLRKLLE